LYADAQPRPVLRSAALAMAPARSPKPSAGLPQLVCLKSLPCAPGECDRAPNRGASCAKMPSALTGGDSSLSLAHLSTPPTLRAGTNNIPFTSTPARSGPLDRPDALFTELRRVGILPQEFGSTELWATSCCATTAKRRAGLRLPRVRRLLSAVGIEKGVCLLWPVG
jgi:hypothetical protein